MIINPKELSIPELHSYLLGAVVPRPIAFASTIDKEGNVNLSPFSFFNCFGSNPPILIFSPARRGRDNTTKHTYENVLDVDEVVINVVNYAIVEQMSLASTEYDKGVNEFVKAGLTPVRSDLVRPPRVGESPVAFECRVNEVRPLGEQGGAGNLVICEVLLMHISEDVLDGNKQIDPLKLDAVARMGGNYYCRASGDSIFEIPKPVRNKGVGIDQLPADIRESTILTGNELARLANVEEIPLKDAAVQAEIGSLFLNVDDNDILERMHTLASGYLAKGDLNRAWQCLLYDNRRAI
ncbi:flavin reductase family protein [Fulvivirga sedimenti]|uniref:Flavin reductase family protein n=1 Tax=Fulvivirga sedimenti TaxID=2879465 RepID=A0A9X1HPL2_9BACT|nr:flavin reductase family protein [Fulvivirga sedimenti]MCA6073867.1 flavin reductase family protein [Fulvivirga sedimenti]